jgi:hypothetical protein
VYSQIPTTRTVTANCSWCTGIRLLDVIQIGSRSEPPGGRGKILEATHVKRDRGRGRRGARVPGNPHPLAAGDSAVVTGVDQVWRAGGLAITRAIRRSDSSITLRPVVSPSPRA